MNTSETLRNFSLIPSDIIAKYDILATVKSEVIFIKNPNHIIIPFSKIKSFIYDDLIFYIHLSDAVVLLHLHRVETSVSF